MLHYVSNHEFLNNTVLTRNYNLHVFMLVNMSLAASFFTLRRVTGPKP